MLGECVHAPLHQGRMKMTSGLSHIAGVCLKIKRVPRGDLPEVPSCWGTRHQID